MGWVWKERDSWRGAYRDESDKRHTKLFKRQIDATQWIATEEAKIVRGRVAQVEHRDEGWTSGTR